MNETEQRENLRWKAGWQKTAKSVSESSEAKPSRLTGIVARPTEGRIDRKISSGSLLETLETKETCIVQIGINML